MKHTQEEKAQALETLKRCFKPGSTVYGITRSVSRSGISRDISIISLEAGKMPSWPNWAVSVLCGYQFVDNQQTAVRSKGCGFNHLCEISGAIEEAIGISRGSLTYIYL